MLTNDDETSNKNCFRFSSNPFVKIPSVKVVLEILKWLRNMFKTEFIFPEYKLTNVHYRKDLRNY